MTFRKKFLATVGAMALVASSMLSIGGVAAQQSDTQTTSIFVENTSCVDETPTSIIIAQDHRQFPNRNPQMPGESTRHGTWMNIQMYVNECLGQGWTVTPSITDFQSGANVIPSDAHFKIAGYNTSPTGVVRLDYFTPVPGTTNLTWDGWTSFTRDGAGATTSTMNAPLSTGTTESTGDMMQVFRPSMQGLPNTIPGGDYTAALTMTFTSDGP